MVNGQSSGSFSLTNNYNNNYNYNQNQSYLDQDSISLNVGQTRNVNLNYGLRNINISHSNSSVASSSLSGNRISITGLAAGVDTLTLTGTNYFGQSVSNTLIVSVYAISTPNNPATNTVNICGINNSGARVCQDIVLSSLNDFNFLTSLNQLTVTKTTQHHNHKIKKIHRVNQQTRWR
jgi:hypothetical protein